MISAVNARLGYKEVFKSGALVRALSRARTTAKAPDSSLLHLGSPVLHQTQCSGFRGSGLARPSQTKAWCSE